MAVNKENNDQLFAGDVKMEQTLEVAGGITDTSSRQVFISAQLGVVGDTAGFVISGDDGSVSIPASTANGDLIIPLSGVGGLQIGDQVTQIELIGEITSSGGSVGWDFALRRNRWDSSTGLSGATLIGTADIDSVTAGATVGPGGGQEISLTHTHTVRDDEVLYADLEVTTAASTSMEVIGILVTFNTPAS